MSPAGAMRPWGSGSGDRRVARVRQRGPLSPSAGGRSPGTKCPGQPQRWQQGQVWGPCSGRARFWVPEPPRDSAGQRLYEGHAELYGRTPFSPRGVLLASREDAGWNPSPGPVHSEEVALHECSLWELSLAPGTRARAWGAPSGLCKAVPCCRTPSICLRPSPKPCSTPWTAMLCQAWGSSSTSCE